MQRSWVMAMLVVSGLLAQAPPAATPPVPVQAPPSETKQTDAKPEVSTPPKMGDPEQAAVKAPEVRAFEQLRPSQRKLAYTLNRAALSAHELGYYHSHPRVLEVREAFETLVKASLPEKNQTTLRAAETYLSKLRSNHGLYDPEGKKILLEGTWKELRAAARAAAKSGSKGLEPRFLRLKGLLYDAKVDAVAPTWLGPAVPAKGGKAKTLRGPRVPEGFAAQKAIMALWVKRAQAWIENTPQEVEVKGEKKTRRLPEPIQTKALNDLLTWLDRDDLELLRDPGFGWLDLRRLGVVPGASLLARAGDIAASKAPEGAAGELTLLPTYEPVMGESRFAKGDEKRRILVEVKQGPAPATLTEQMETFEKLARSREIEVK